MKYSLIPFLLLASHLVFSQGYEGEPCTSGYSGLKDLLQKKVIKEQYIQECGPHSNAVTTSFLKASGKAPISVKDPNFKPPPDLDPSVGDEVYDDWTCMYAAIRAIDGNTSTSWVEGEPGNGKGELLLITNLDLSKSIEIFAGFGKNDNLFKVNNRPKNIRIHIWRATYVESSQCGSLYENILLITSGQTTLRDIYGFQPLSLPAFKSETFQRDGNIKDYNYWLMIELIDVYPGTKYDDTCISEIRNVK